MLWLGPISLILLTRARIRERSQRRAVARTSCLENVVA